MNPKIVALKKERAKSIDAAKAIKATAEAEKREPSDEEMAAIQGHLDAAAATKIEIEKAEARAATLRAVDAEFSEIQRQPGRRAGGDTPAAVDAAERLPINMRERSEDDPNRGFKGPRDFFMAVLNAGQRGHVDNRLKPLMTGPDDSGLKPRNTAGGDEQGEYADPYGNFLIPVGFSPTLLQITPEADPTAGRTMQIPMSSPMVKIPARTDKNHTSSVTGGLRWYRRAEADTVSSSRMEFEQVEMKANPLMGVTFATEELISDSPISIVALISQGFKDELGATELNEKLNGSGVGQFVGANNAPCLIEVAKEANQAAATIVTQNILNARSRCWGYSNAVWIANHDTYPQLAQLVLAIGTGGVALYQPSLVDDRPDMLLGRPIFYSEFANTLGTAGDLLLGNWSQYLEGTLQGMDMQESIHVRFVNNERCFRATKRNDGQPWWKTALTPKKSSKTLSPFVRIATRA